MKFCDREPSPSPRIGFSQIIAKRGPLYCAQKVSVHIETCHLRTCGREVHLHSLKACYFECYIFQFQVLLLG
ncbi:unnamed protein product [Allacma fusca]|uniref:Uncharacterized protein n=1 Tax=Allacma fusca TaxID=39272 RepID=A0A8J2JVB1_9HEXA|nr:unnamed protein product [Allacma fusca]